MESLSEHMDLDESGRDSTQSHLQHGDGGQSAEEREQLRATAHRVEEDSIADALSSTTLNEKAQMTSDLKAERERSRLLESSLKRNKGRVAALTKDNEAKASHVTRLTQEKAELERECSLRVEGIKNQSLAKIKELQTEYREKEGERFRLPEETTTTDESLLSTSTSKGVGRFVVGAGSPLHLDSECEGCGVAGRLLEDMWMEVPPLLRGFRVRTLRELYLFARVGERVSSRLEVHALIREEKEKPLDPQTLLYALSLVCPCRAEVLFDAGKSAVITYEGASNAEEQIIIQRALRRAARSTTGNPDTLIAVGGGVLCQQMIGKFCPEQAKWLDTQGTTEGLQKVLLSLIGEKHLGTKSTLLISIPHNLNSEEMKNIIQLIEQVVQSGANILIVADLVCQESSRPRYVITQQWLAEWASLNTNPAIHITSHWHKLAYGVTPLASIIPLHDQTHPAPYDVDAFSKAFHSVADWISLETVVTPKTTKQGNEGIKCYNCREVGHAMRNCPINDKRKIGQIVSGRIEKDRRDKRERRDGGEWKGQRRPFNPRGGK